MSAMNYEQENNVLDQLTDNRHNALKMQTTEMKGKTRQVLATPTAKGLLSMKTPFGKSSRKAFGNVSNVLRSETKPSAAISGKMQTKEQTVTKADHQLKNASQLDEKKGLTAVDTNSTTDAKYCIEMEGMYPSEGELMSDTTDSITRGLFDIDDQIVFGMEFDSDLSQCLAPKSRNFDFNHFI